MKNKEIKKLFLVLGLYAFSGGIFYNFQELWMAENNLSVKTIGIVFSLCALITVSTIFLCSNIIKQEKIKNFTCILLLLKTIIISLLFILNSTGLNILIKFLIMADYAIDTEIYACIYPMISLISKSNKVYAARGLVYSWLYYLGVLLSAVFLGKTFLVYNINYNFYLLIGAITAFIAYIILYNTDLDKYKNNENEENVSNDILNKLVKNLKNDRISKNYLMFLFTGDISYYCVTSLKLILLTNYLEFSPAKASNILLILGIISVGIGTLVLSKLTLKNNYINISIKYIGRLITYVLAAFISNKITFAIVLIYVILTSESYSHVTDAPYVNRFEGKYQFAFYNLKEMVGYFSRAIGTFICGLVISTNVQLMFIIASIFITFQIIFAFRALYLRNLESRELNNDRK